MRYLSFLIMIIGGYVMGYSHAEREKPRTYLAQCYAQRDQHEP